MSATATTAAAATSSITSTIQKLEAEYAPQASAAAHRAAATYFGSLIPLQVVSVILTTVFVIGIIMLLRKSGYVRVRLERVDDVIFRADHTKRLAKKTWSEVERHFFSGSDNDLKIAIVKADTLLDEALREAGVTGADMGERLRRLTAEDLPNLDHVWEAHRLRNRIAHEADFSLKRDLAERALTVYEEALEQMGALEKRRNGGSGSKQPEGK